MKHIPAEKLIAEIERLSSSEHPIEYEPVEKLAYNRALSEIEDAITSLQQEQPEISNSLVDVDAVREDFVTKVYRVLDADPTNDRANAIINAFDSLPTVSREPLEVDLEKEIEIYFGRIKWGSMDMTAMRHQHFEKCARHFYELGLNTRKEESK